MNNPCQFYEQTLKPKTSVSKYLKTWPFIIHFFPLVYVKMYRLILIYQFLIYHVQNMWNDTITYISYTHFNIQIPNIYIKFCSSARQNMLEKYNGMSKKKKIAMRHSHEKYTNWMRYMYDIGKLWFVAAKWRTKHRGMQLVLCYKAYQSISRRC